MLTVSASLDAQLSEPRPIGGMTLQGGGSFSDNNATFSVGMVRPGSLAYAETAAVGDYVTITGTIRPDPAHVGAIADVFVVANIGGKLYQLGSGGFVAWNTRFNSLEPYRSNVTLTSEYAFTLFEGAFDTAGSYRYFLGYMPADGRLRFTPTPTRLTIGESTGSTSNTAAALIAGTWRVNEATDASECGEGSYSDTYTATVTPASANYVSVSANGITRPGVVGHNVMNYDVSFPEDGGTTRSSGTIYFDGDSFTGNGTFTYTEGGFSCSGSSSLSGVRLSGGALISDVPAGEPGIPTVNYDGNSADFAALVPIGRRELLALCESLGLVGLHAEYQPNLNGNPFGCRDPQFPSLFKGPNASYLDADSDQTVNRGSYVNHKMQGFEDMDITFAPDGPFRSWHDNGVIKQEYYMSRGRHTGKSTEWDRNGTVVTTGQYTNGRQDGEWWYYDASGEPTRRSTFNEGTETSRETFTTTSTNRPTLQTTGAKRFPPYEYSYTCPDRFSGTITIPSADSEECQKVFENYARVFACNLIGEFASAQKKYNQCEAAPQGSDTIFDGI